MHSHHSHSGQYVQHAKDSLEQCIDEAIRFKYETFCLTEHMPRLDQRDIYPEELESGTSVESLAKTFGEYYHHAKRLQKETTGVKLLVGTEVEHIDQQYYPFIAKLRQQYEFDLVVGSIHHVDTVPIDYNFDLWAKSRDQIGGTLKMFERYFDDQYEMMQQVRPNVVGHFDLIMLFSNENLISEPTVWGKIERNIDYAVEIGAMIEVNSAAIRKGWSTPYPSEPIASFINKKGGQFCLSDDSHGVSQVALNYHRSIDYLKKLGVTAVYYLDIEDGKVIKKQKSMQECIQWCESVSPKSS